MKGRTFRSLLALLSLGALLGCTSGPPYQAPAAEQSAYVAVGHIAEDQSFTQGGAALQIVAVDGNSTGLAQAVHVTPGTHRFTMRHFDGYALIFANVRYADISFQVQPEGDYRIDGSYCCGFLLGMFDLYAYDHRSGEQVAQVKANAPK